MKRILFRLLTLILILTTLFTLVTACKDDPPPDDDDDGGEEENGDNSSKPKIKTISILGDSYSSYGGTVPAGNRSFYNGESETEDTTDVSDMWWHKLIAYKGYQLEVNQSSSGSPVCNTGYNGSDATSHSFLKRMKNIGNPDVIAVFGGTNDAWAKVPIGEYKFMDWTDTDLKTFRPAFAYMCDYLQTEHPDAEIYVIINSELSTEVTESMKAISDYYNIEWVVLTLTKDDKPFGSHPGKDGQNKIFEDVKDMFD